MPPRSSRTALRNLLLVLAVAIGALVYSYGWTVTDIDLAKPQEVTRQNSLTNALREMLSPRIFEQNRVQLSAGAEVLYGCDEGESPDIVTLVSDTPGVTISPTCGSAGDVITVKAAGFAPESDAQIRWVPLTGQSRPRDVIGTGENIIILDDMGGFEGQIEVPRLSGAAGQVHRIEFRASTPDGAPYLSGTANEVLRRMAETVFMALVATSLAIPIAVLISFFAAHNLMRNIRMPLGSAMLWVIILPFGYLLGTLVLGAVGQFGFNLGRGAALDAAITAFIPLTFGLGLTAATQQPGLGAESAGNRLTGVGVRLLAALVLVLVIGLIGGLCARGENLFVSISEGIRPEEVTNIIGWLLNAIADGINGFATMVGVIGGIIGLGIVPFAGFAGGIALASSAVMLARPYLREISGVFNTGLGAVMGGISGMFIMLAIGYVGMSAALFGLLPALATALLSGAVVSGIVHRLLAEKPEYEKSGFERIGRIVARIAGLVGGFLFAILWLNAPRALALGVLPNAEASGLFGLPDYLVKCGMIGLVLGAAGGGLSGVRSAFGIGNVLYNISREILNVLRSIEPLIMAIIFVIWVGIGPFAGVLALMLHSIASLGKLYSEQIETIDSGPIEALQSTGANHLQTIVYAVVPQIVPPYIAFTMYRWDINVRMSTIIGFVGGGGIGLLLNQQINLLRYRDAGVAVLAIAVVVSVLDYASAKIRERVL